jgi:uncharacterized C2H2 Zn-finger protein
MKTGYNESVANEEGLYCFRCNVTLVSDKVFLQYLTSTFPTQLLKCPQCGLVHIDEKTVMTKALEVERTLEEK